MSKFCSKCGNSIPEDALFCNHCGVKIEEVLVQNSKTNEIPRPSEKPENITRGSIINTITSSYYYGPTVISGKVTFYESGLEFISGKIAFQKGSIFINYSDILRAEKGDAALTAVDLITKDYITHTIIAFNRKDVIEFINFMIDKAPKNVEFIPPKYILNNSSCEATSKETEEASNFFVWIIALAPLLGMIMDISIASNPYGEFLGVPIAAPGTAVGAMGYKLVYIINVILGYVDAINVHKSTGKEIKGSWSFLIPIYLFKRAKLLNQPKSYAIIWCITFAISLFAI